MQGRLKLSAESPPRCFSLADDLVSLVEKKTALKSHSKWFGVDSNTAGDS